MGKSPSLFVKKKKNVIICLSVIHKIFISSIISINGYERDPYNVPNNKSGSQ